MTDGLGILDQQRSRRARTIPSPKHPPRSTPVAVVELQPREEVDPEDGGILKAPPAPTPETNEVKARGETVADPTVKMSIYLEPSDDLYLEEIAHAGKIGRPRVAISRSAIVRLALEQLAKTMTTGDVVAELRKRGTHHQGRGRKRR